MSSAGDRGSLARPASRDPQRILIVRLSALGDVVHVLPMLDALRAARPDAHIGWVVEEKAADLLRDHPQIDRLWVLPRARVAEHLRRFELVAAVRALWSFFRALRAVRYELALDCQSNLRSSLATWLSAAPRRVGFAAGFAKEGAQRLHTQSVEPRPGHVLKVERYLELLRALDLPVERPRPRVALPVELRTRAGAAMAALGPGPAVLIHPGVSGRGSIKRWDPARFGAVARELAEAGARCLVSWGPGEREQAERVVAASEGAARLGPETGSLRELAALLAAADLVIACDTGPLHLAAALGVPVVGLYGPKDPAVYAPWQARTGAPAPVVRRPVPCSPCNANRCALSEVICMPAIEVDDVVAAAREALGPAASSAAATA